MMGKMEDKDNNTRTRGTDGLSLSDLPLYGKCIRKLVIIRICWYILNFQHLDIKLTKDVYKADNILFKNTLT